MLAISQLLTWPHSVIVNDIKGDLYRETAGYRKTLGPVFVIDPQGYGHRYDPLLGKHKEEELKSIAKKLLYKKDERDEIFTLRAIRQLTPLFHAARIENHPPLPYVGKMINEPLPDVVERLYRLSSRLATKFLDTRYEEASFSDKFLLSSWGTLTAKLDTLLTETIVRCFAASDFTAEEIITSDKPITVYLRFTERDLLVLSPLIKLLWSSIIDELITTYDKTQGKNCKPVLLLIDEAGRTAIPNLADHATTVVGRGVSLWIAVQDLSQLEEIYSSFTNFLLDKDEL